MLISFHFPLSDTRGFFASELGRIPQLSDAERRKDLLFLRSIGMRHIRNRGGGDNILNEANYFPLDRAISIRLDSSTPQLTGLGRLELLKRLFVLDEATMRAEIGFASKGSGPKRLSITNICDFLLGAQLSSPNSIFLGSHQLEQSGRFIASLVQSRTTLEVYLKRKIDIQSVHSGIPVVMVEGYDDEIILGNRAQPLPLKEYDGNISLFHFYPTANMRGWLILRKRDSKTKTSDAVSARLIRMYLSRMYVQGNTFRTLARKMPEVIHKTDEIIPRDTAAPALYVEYIARNRRFMGSMSKDLSSVTGHEYGKIASLAHNMIEAEEEQEILEAHERVMQVNQIFRNFANDVKNEAALSKSFSENERGGKSTNIIINILGSMRGIRQTQAPLIAKSQINVERIIPHFERFTQFMTLRTGGLSKLRFLSILSIFTEIKQLLNADNLCGPAIIPKLNQIKDICQTMEYDKEKAMALIDEIIKEISI